MQENRKRWTVIDLINWTVDYLSRKGFENSRLEVERLLCKVLNFNRLELYLKFDRPLDKEELLSFKTLLKRRLSHQPLQYILGETEFYSLSFTVNNNVLIPRPETEILVQIALELCKEEFKSYPCIQVLDIGTGSGNIAISIAKNESRSQIHAIDVSQKSLEIAYENAKSNHVEDKIVFKQTDILKDLPEELYHRFDLVVSNPPYIKKKDFDDLPREIREYEPTAALLAAEDGLLFYNSFASKFHTLSKKRTFFLFEIAEDLTDEVVNLFKNAGASFKVYKDLSGKERVVGFKNGEENE